MAGADPAEDLNCNVCNFQTNRTAFFYRHIQSERHKNMTFLQNEQHSPTIEDTVSSEKCQETSAVLLSEDEGELPSDEYSNHGNNETASTGHARLYTTSDSQIQGDWYPFTSKIEMLCYIFMSSASHPVVSLIKCEFLNARHPPSHRDLHVHTYFMEICFI